MEPELHESKEKKWVDPEPDIIFDKHGIEVVDKRIILDGGRIVEAPERICIKVHASVLGIDFEELKINPFKILLDKVGMYFKGEVFDERRFGRLWMCLSVLDDYVGGQSESKWLFGRRIRWRGGVMLALIGTNLLPESTAVNIRERIKRSVEAFQLTFFRYQIGLADWTRNVIGNKFLNLPFDIDLVADPKYLDDLADFEPFPWLELDIRTAQDGARIAYINAERYHIGGNTVKFQYHGEIIGIQDQTKSRFQVCQLAIDKEGYLYFIDVPRIEDGRFVCEQETPMKQKDNESPIEFLCGVVKQRAKDIAYIVMSFAKVGKQFGRLPIDFIENTATLVDEVAFNKVTKDSVCENGFSVFSAMLLTDLFIESQIYIRGLNIKKAIDTLIEGLGEILRCWRVAPEDSLNLFNLLDLFRGINLHDIPITISFPAMLQRGFELRFGNPKMLGISVARKMAYLQAAIGEQPFTSLEQAYTTNWLLGWLQGQLIMMDMEEPMRVLLPNLVEVESIPPKIGEF